MNFQFISYLIPLLISALITLGLAIYGYKYRTVKGAKPFTISMVIGVLWAVSNGLEMAGTDLYTKIFWANCQYFAYAFAPVTWVIMVFKFTGKENWVNRRYILLLSIIPFITMILVWTNSYHHLIRYNVELNTEGVFPVVAKEYGLWFWVHTIYGYILNSSSIIFLMRASWRRNNVYRKQVYCLFIGFAILFLSSFLYVIGLTPIERFDISPVLFSLSGLIIGWGIFHFRLFDLVPVARTTVIEEMGAGIIVIDKKNRIIDINPRAKEMFVIEDKDACIGNTLSDIFGSLSVLANFISFDGGMKSLHKEFTLKIREQKYYYELFSSPIKDYRQELVARVLIINDITDLKRAREQINMQQKELAVMDERERMARDLHDNLGQILSFSSIQLQAVRQQFKKGNFEEGDESLQELKEIIRDAHKEIREYVYNIRDNTDYNESFLTLLQELVKKFRKNSDIKIIVENKFKSPEGYAGNSKSGFLGTEEKMQLINIIKESLTNVLKYAEADTVNIMLNSEDKNFKIMVEDNGKGIDKLNKTRGSGLNIMNERVKLIGGRLKIESQSGLGTRVIVNLPIDGGDNCENNDS